jgi:hypothetical protein
MMTLDFAFYAIGLEQLRSKKDFTTAQKATVGAFWRTF